MKKTTISFLSAAVAFGVLLTGCATGADSNKKEAPVTQKEAPVKEENPVDKITVSPKHEKLIKEAMESAKQGKQVKMDKQYQQISWGEIEKVLGEPYLAGPEDGGSMTYAAGKYEITFSFNCHGECVANEELGIQTKLVSMGVEEANVTKEN
ncbi:hypothetical protein [Shimazuella kribbensis]|uniref:hypothetical protein n=1 Tax=Shimazuella kribbensis TaxID=139808 RepID=UPI000428AB97|nr:hypothetical protein [Shimazuella kribbensis]